MKRILLMGNPNVGKSSIFSRVTGVNTIISNYAGTTIEFLRGYIDFKGERYQVIDVPGSYSLIPTNEAEKVAVDILNEGCDIVISVIDATNLERNLNQTLQILKRNIPAIVVLNMWDETKHTGIEIDVEKMEEILGVPVIPTCGRTGEGIKKLVESLNKASVSNIEYKEFERWLKIGEIVEKVQKTRHRHHTFFELLGDISIHPLAGIPIALVILFITFSLIRIIGEFLIGGSLGLFGDPWVELPFGTELLFDKLWLPVVTKLSEVLGQGNSGAVLNFVHNILIGKLIDGGIDFGQSFGILTTGIFIPIGAVLPYILSFYFMLSILEDCGYLPRLGVLVDNIFHRVGLHGLSIIPMLLGLGCNVPGALATRILETRKERLIGSTLMAISIPCMAQIAMIAGLIGPHGATGFFAVFGTLLIVWFIIGFLMKIIIKGESPEIFMEIPPYRIPYWKAILKKLWMRILSFLKEALPFVMIGVFIVNLLYTLGIIDFFGTIFSPVVTKILGLPAEAVGALLVGFLRKDVAVGMLAPLNLSLKQLIIGSVVLAMYFPCVATFAVLAKELGVKDMLKSVVIMLVSTLIVGGILNLVIRG